MNSATTGSVAVGSRRPQAGVALIAALAFGCLVAVAAYADRTGALSPASSALSQSAVARAQLASALSAAPHKAAHSRHLMAWKAPHVPKVHPPAALPPRVVTISAPAPAPAAPVVAAAPAPAPAPPATTGEDSGGSDD